MDKDLTRVKVLEYAIKTTTTLGNKIALEQELEREYARIRQFEGNKRILIK
jgi:hypothetical protein